MSVDDLAQYKSSVSVNYCFLAEIPLFLLSLQFPHFVALILGPQTFDRGTEAHVSVSCSAYTQDNIWPQR